ncbi:MAG: restriction endonuclease subunit S [Thermodesulfovibrionales bacterium]
MSKWLIQPLLQACQLTGNRVNAFTEMRPYVSTGDVNGNDVTPSASVTFDARPSRADLGANNGDILFARMQATEKVVLVTGERSNYIWSTGFAALRPKQGTNSRWVAYWLQSQPFQERKNALCTGATQKAITNDAIRELSIPIPPLAEQERIVRILDEADQLRRLRAEADERTAQAISGLFSTMFSESRAAENRWPVVSMGELFLHVSGATPSTENPDFWSGAIPWVSPKDMKTPEINDTTDHISDAALKSSRLRLLPKDTVLIVVRGMILAHTFPVTITRVPVTINQDMKALLPRAEIEPDYLHWLLKSNAAKILSLVSTAGHGTKRLEMALLLGLTVSVPPKSLQREFSSYVSQVRTLEAAQVDSRRRLDDFFHSLLHRAFQGEL